MKLSTLSLTRSQDRDSPVALDFSFIENAAGRIANASYSNTDALTVANHLGETITLPAGAFPQEGGHVIRNLFSLSEGNSSQWNGQGTTPPSLTNTTLNGKSAVAATFALGSVLYYPGSRVQSDNASMTFTAQPSSNYAARLRVKLSRPLVNAEALYCYVAGAQGFTGTTINASNCTPFLNEVGDHVYSWATYTEGSPGIEYWVIFLDGTLASDLTVIATEAMAVELPYSATNVLIKELPYVSRGILSAPYQGYGVDGLLWWNRDLWGYPLPLHDCWIENQIKYSADWSQSTVYNVVSASAASDGFYALAKTTTHGSASANKLVNPAYSSNTSLSVTIELRAGTSREASFGIYDSNAWGSTNDAIAQILSGPGQVEPMIGTLFRVGGLNATETTVVSLVRNNTVTTSDRRVYLYPGTYLSDRPGESILVRRTRVAKTSAILREFQRNTLNFYEAGALLSNELPNSTAQQLAVNQFPIGWTASYGSGITVSCLGTGVLKDEFTRYVDFQFSGTASSLVTCSVYPCWQAVSASVGETWSSSVWVQALEGVEQPSSCTLDIEERENTAAYLAHGSQALTLSDAASTYCELTRTLTDAATTFVNPRIALTFAPGAGNCTLRIHNWSLREGAPVPFVATGSVREARASYSGYRSDATTPLVLGLADGAYRITYTRGDATTHTEYAIVSGNNYATPNLGTLRRVVAEVQAEPIVLDLRSAVFNPGPEATYTGSGSLSRTVVDHDKRVWCIRTNELPRIGLRRVEQLCPNAKWDHTYGSLPTSYSQPSGVGTYSIPVFSLYGSDANAFLQRCDNNRAYFSINVTLEAYKTYTMSVLVESLSTTLSLAQVLLPISLPADSVVVDAAGNAVVGERNFVVFTTGSVGGSGTLRFGLGCSSNVTAIGQFSRPMLVEGNNVGEDKWIADNVTYNAIAQGVAYFDEDQSNNSIRRESAQGIESWTNLTSITSSNHDVTSWTLAGVSATLGAENNPGTGPYQLLTETSGNVHEISKACIPLASKDYLVSFVVKQGTRKWIKIGFQSTWACLDIENQEIGSTYGSPAITLSSLAEGYTRVDMRVYSTSSSQTTVYLRLCIGNAVDSYASEGASLYFFWGQVVQAQNNAPLIKQTVSSNPLAVSLSRHFPTFNKAGGRVVAEYELSDNDGYRGVFSVCERTNFEGNRYDVRGAVLTSTYLQALGSSANSTGFVVTLFRNGLGDIFGKHKLAISFKANELGLSQDGSGYAVDTSGVLPVTLDTIVLGALTPTTYALCGRLFKLVYYPGADLASLPSLSSLN